MARDRHRIRRDAAGVGPDPEMAGRLYRLGEADYRIVDGEPDIRGWEVRTLAGNEVGAVGDLLIDPDRGEVVMLDINLKDSDQKINIPIRGVQLDRSRRRVVVDSGDVRRARESYMGDLNEDVRMRGDLRVSDEREVVVERRPFVDEVVLRRQASGNDVQPHDNPVVHDNPERPDLSDREEER